MEKRIMLAVCATFALAGQVQASAPIINAATRFMLTSAGIGGAGLYAAEKHPVAFDRVGSLLSGSQAPIAHPQAIQQTQIAEMISKGISEGLKQVPQPTPTIINTGGNGTLGSLSLPSAQQAGIGAGALFAAFVIYDSFYGHKYTQRAIKSSTDFMHKKIKEVYSMLKGMDTKINTVNDQVQELSFKQRKAILEAEYNAKKASLEHEALDKKVTLPIEIQNAANRIILLQAQLKHKSDLQQNDTTIKKEILKILEQVADKNTDFSSALERIDTELAQKLEKLDKSYQEKLAKLDQETTDTNAERRTQRQQEQESQEQREEQVEQEFEMPSAGIYEKAASCCEWAKSKLTSFKVPRLTW